MWAISRSSILVGRFNSHWYWFNSACIIYHMTYKMDLYINPKVKIRHFPILSAEETEQCKKVVGFDKFVGETYMHLLVNEQDDTVWCVVTATHGDCDENMLDLVNYLTDDFHVHSNETIDLNKSDACPFDALDDEHAFDVVLLQ